jgi:shikimate dehydrogenase
MNISGKTRVFLILGDPVAQVRAPEVFNALFRKHGVNAVLVPAQVAPRHLEGFVKQVLAADNIDGLWLTIPHKAAVLPLLAHCDTLGRLAGAVRRNADGSLEGALFDGIGFVKGLDRFGIATNGRRVLVIGVGGGGEAIAASLAQRGCAELALFDAAPGRGQQVADRLNATFSTRIAAAASADPAGFDLVINSTPLGLKLSDPLPFDVARLDRGAAVVDILMKNQPTALLRACAARGIDAFPGFEMMLQQMPEYLNFFGLHTLAQAVQEDASEVRALLEPG